MRLKIINTGSKGNCYILTDKNGKQLIVECGIPYAEICEHIVDWTAVDGCIITHSHKDHSLSRERLERFGVDIRSTDNLTPLKSANMGSYKVVGVPTPHSVLCYSYYVATSEGKNCVIITDTNKISLRANAQFDIVLVEVDYCQSVILDRIARGERIREQYENHLELNAVREWLESLPKKPKQVVAIHTSKNNADRELILDTLSKVVPNTTIATANMEIEF